MLLQQLNPTGSWASKLPRPRPQQLKNTLSCFYATDTTICLEYMSCTEFHVQRIPSTVQDMNKDIEQEKDVNPSNLSMNRLLAGSLAIPSYPYYDLHNG